MPMNSGSIVLRNSMFWYNDRFDISVTRGTGTDILRVDMNLVINSVTYRPLRFDNVGNVSIAATTASTSTTTGALVVSGGLGIAGTINVGGSTNILSGSSTIGRETLMSVGRNVSLNNSL